MCQVFKVSRSGFYAWLRRGKSKRRKENENLLKKIQKIYIKNKRVYGSPRMTDALRKQGIKCGKNRVARLMRENGIASKTHRRFKVTTNSDHKRPVAPNLLKRNFTASAPNKVWTSDITYIWTDEGWLYLAVVLDLYSRKIVGWSMSERMKDQLVIDAFVHAWWRRKPSKGLIFHSDRGSQYCSNKFINHLKSKGIEQSMSSTGCCYDNAVTESFFHTLKVEEVYHERYRTRHQARSAIFEYIEGFYNRVRTHSTLGYKTPEDFERLKLAA